MLYCGYIVGILLLYSLYIRRIYLVKSISVQERNWEPVSFRIEISFMRACRICNWRAFRIVRHAHATGAHFELSGILFAPHSYKPTFDWCSEQIFRVRALSFGCQLNLRTLYLQANVRESTLKFSTHTLVNRSALKAPNGIFFIR